MSPQTFPKIWEPLPSSVHRNCGMKPVPNWGPTVLKLVMNPNVIWPLSSQCMWTDTHFFANKKKCIRFAEDVRHHRKKIKHSVAKGIGVCTLVCWRSVRTEFWLRRIFVHKILAGANHIMRTFIIYIFHGDRKKMGWRGREEIELHVRS